jgi:predicted ATP-grasp superfamily ATP-dependent carboligase
VVGGETKRTLSGSSKYCSETLTYPSPGQNPEAFISTVASECEQRGISVIFPMTDLSTATVLRHRQQFQQFKLPFVEFAAFDEVTDKWRLFELAERLHVSMPKTHCVKDLSSLDSICPRLRFPAVLKPYRSMIYSNGRWIAASVQYANSVRELRETIAKYEYLNQHPFLIQEYIAGEAQGIFALYDHGRPLAFFAHCRLRENPPSGGVSVLSESIPIHPEQQRMAQAILDSVGWHGVAMVEFKVAADGTPYLMEVNGRFWGSLQLAIDAGVDFPWLLYQLASGKDLDNWNGYAIGVRWRWWLGDLARLYKVLASNGSSPCQPVPGKVRSVLQFLGFFEKNARYERNFWSDIKPFLFELRQFLRHGAAQVTTRDDRRALPPLSSPQILRDYPFKVARPHASVSRKGLPLG